MVASVCVGKSMGEGNAKKAILYSTLIALYTFFVNLIIAIFITIFKREIAMIFTDQIDLVTLVSHVLPLMSLALVLMSLSFT
jgi:Na+-driven multidrug efflux pump